jgi:hypothetical protein
MIAQRVDQTRAQAPDRLDWRLVAALYALALVPYGPLVVVVGSSVAYYFLRQSRPVTARQLNRHAFAAFGLAVALVIALKVLHT